MDANALVAWYSDRLITRHIDTDGAATPDEARVRPVGCHVWAVVGAVLMDGIDDTATDYRLSREAVVATMAFYERHKAVVDARLTLQRAAFTDWK